MENKIELRRLSECSFEQAVQIWNSGFKGYRVDMTRCLDAYLVRLHHDDLSPELSFVAFSADQPAGFLLNGIRNNGSKKVAWNGGTAISPEFRGKGVGHTLLSAAISLYRDQGVEFATLEAISDNEPAIALYEKFGYETVDRLLFLQRDGALSSPFVIDKKYSVRNVAPASLQRLDFYDHSAPWSTQWQCVALRGGAAVIVSDERGKEIGYALYAKTYAEGGEVTAVTLFQCVAAPGSHDAEGIVTALLDEVYGPHEVECRRSTFNLSKKYEVVQRQLEKSAFVPFIEQLHMVKRLKPED